MTATFSRLSALAFIVWLVGCSQAVDSSKQLPTGNWRATLSLPGGALNFGLELGREGEGYRATLINGQERVSVPRVDYADGQLTLVFPAYNNRIDAALDGGRLVGNLELVKHDGTQMIPFVAEHGTAPTTRTVTEGETDVSGRWAATFTEPDGSTYPAVGEFAQRGARLFGTFLTPTGDYRYLGGELRGRGFNLSTFDGAHAFLFKAEVLPDGSLQGDFWSGLNWHETWRAARAPNAKLPDPNRLTIMKPGYEGFEFEFPDQDGNPVSLDDARFDGRVVIVTLAGSWCPNCHDVAAFMTQLYRKYHKQGLEIVALMFEYSEDFELAAEQVRQFRKKFSIQYPTLIAGTPDKDHASAVLPQLNRVLAFPTTIFIGRGGKVRRIYTGFTGPGTGEHYTKLQQDFTKQIESLLAEKIVPVPIPDPAAGDARTGGDSAATDGSTTDPAAGDPAAFSKDPPTDAVEPTPEKSVEPD